MMLNLETQIKFLLELLVHKDHPILHRDKVKKRLVATSYMS